jgi:DNA topoisomerase-1
VRALGAGLRYGSDREPGLRRVRRGRGFGYIDAAGRPVTSEAVLARVRALAIPPAWRDVWICASARGHVQATGRDARGRKQYRYHATWSSRRNETKFGRMLAFGEALPRIRRRVAADLARRGLPRRKVLATVVRLLERSLLRIGCDEYARSNDAYVLATLCERHVRVRGTRVQFRFRGKGGKRQAVQVKDGLAARVVRRCLELPGRELFQYRDGAGEVGRVVAADVNDYLREIAGEELSAKDFRTWGASILVLLALKEQPVPASRAAARRVASRAIGFAAEQLGNTPTVCRRYYVHPGVLDAWEAGAFRTAAAAGGSPSARFAAAERALLDLLREPARTRKAA